MVDAPTGVRELAFDHHRLAAALSEAAGRPYTCDRLPFDAIELTEDGAAWRFTVEGSRWEFSRLTGRCSLAQVQNGPPPAEATSPDRTWAAFVKDYNLYARPLSSGSDPIQFTGDGELDCAYGSPLSSPLLEAGLGDPERPAVVWSPTSRYFLSYRIDARKSGRLRSVQSTPKDGTARPKDFGYVYPLPGDDEVPVAFPVVCHIPTGEAIRVDIEPLPLLYFGGPRHPVWWSPGGERLYVLNRRRGFQTTVLHEIDPLTGRSRTILEETASTGWDPRASHWPDTHNVRILNGGEKVIWYSWRDGWGHLYLCDGATGRVLNRITEGPWVVHDVLHVNERDSLVYFTAGGREEERDPYYRHLYRAPLDGNNLELLTPEDGDHEVIASPSGSYFIDTWSRMDSPPTTVLRRADGSRFLTLEEADIAPLLATGWRFPERFCVKARDGITDLYGVIFRPSSFTPTKRYPVIERIYQGPQGIAAPRGFAGGPESGSPFWHDQALAELGFIVIVLDGLGTSWRSKAFLDCSYRNLGDAGLDDHVSALRQLADRDPSLDLTRVGIYGYSAGGYAATRAILTRPDFYKVAIAWAGNHDHRLDKAGWVERYMGLPVGDHYLEQANATLAGRLKGRLFLMHGEMDENVPLAATLRLAAALIEENKDFDLLILPNGTHASGNHPYVTRRRWDYFVRHLLEMEPPPEYKLNA
ncbi:MAG TPA: DPP IV N-terminal domain-containing protein [Bacillota bacterium]|nr:DPP IV N-terminal domain-containing protein [Bacillota bacterium]